MSAKPILSFWKFVEIDSHSHLKEVIMKRLRKFLYSFTLVAVMIFTVAMFTVACGETQDDKPAKEYTIRLMLGVDSEYDSYKGKAGSTVVFTQPDPTRVNAVFDGWSKTPDGDIVALPTVMPAEDATYYAVFSRRYTLTLNAGDGTLEQRSLSVKANQNLYSLVKDIVPAAPGDSTFDAWYYGNRKIDAASTVSMPSSSITLEARYTIGYNINIFKENTYASGEYTKSDSDAVKGVGFVGSTPKDSDYPGFAGYEINADKSGNTSQHVLNASGGNVFDVYYSVIGCQIIFNSNAPADTKPSGKTESEVWGYNVANEIPECGYGITGYRFSYWSTKADGSGEKYYAGNELTVTDTTTLYAVWTKGYTEFNGASYDYIYLDEDESGETKVYLQRLYSDEIEGEYDKASNEFVFKENNEIITRGKIDIDGGYYICINSDSYALRTYDNDHTSNGAISSDVTLEVATDGTAVYKDTAKSLTVSGKFSADNDTGSLEFVPNNAGAIEPFFFRLTSVDGRYVFDIRGSEYGNWQNMIGDTVNEYQRLMLDGYGNAMMVAKNGEGTNGASSTTAGIYRYTQATSEDKPEISIVFFPDGSLANIAEITVVLRKGTFGSYDKAFVTNQFSTMSATAFYAKPADGATLDPDTADKLVLDGYGVFADSATLVSGATESKGRYVLDGYINQVKFLPSAGLTVTYEISTVKVGETSYNVYEVAEEVCDNYAIRGLESSYNAGEAHRLRIMNNGEAWFMFRIPSTDNVFGDTSFVYTVAFTGKYTAIPGSDKEYVFKATYDPATALQIAYIYNTVYGKPLYVNNFFDFKFKVTDQKDSKGQYWLCDVTAIGDGYVDYRVTHDGIVYTTDGYGKATGTDGSEKEYSVITSMGMPFLQLRWKNGSLDDNNKPAYDVHNYVKVDDEFIGIAEDYVKFNNRYLTYFGDSVFYMSVLEDGNALLGYVNGSGMKFYSYGKITWNNDKTFGSYQEIVCKDTVGSILIAQYGDFKFGIKTVEVEGEDVQYFYIYDPTLDSVENGVLTVENSDGLQLIINKNDNTAQLKTPNEDKTDYTTISGDVKYSGDVLGILYTFVDDTDGKDYVALRSFKLKYSDDKTRITSFVEVGAEAGLWKDEDGSLDYYYLSGEKNGDGKFIGIYYEYTGAEDSETVSESDYVAHDGTYERTAEKSVREVKFTYSVDSADSEEEQPVSVIFKVAYSETTFMPEYKLKTTDMFSKGVYVYSGLSSDPVGYIAGGGYAPITFGPNQTNRVTGTVGIYQNTDLLIISGLQLYVFNRNGSPYFYFTVMSDGEYAKLVMLDGAYSADNFGLFDCETPYEIEKFPVPNKTEGSDEVTYTETDISVKKLQINGLGYALLVTDTDKGTGYLAYYVAVDSSTLQLYTIVDNNVRTLGFFRMYTRNNEEESGETTKSYVVKFADMQLRKTFVGERGSSVTTDGFSAITYIDSDGVYHNGTYTQIENHPEVFRVVYLNTNGVISTNTLYIEIKADGTFAVLDENDDRIPQDSGDGETANR